jgi:hypothetical protein
MARLTRLIGLLGVLLLALVLAAPATASTRPATPYTPTTADAPCGDLAAVTKAPYWEVPVGRPIALDVLADDCVGQATATRPVTIVSATTNTVFGPGYGSVTTDGRTVFYNPSRCTLGDGGFDYISYTITDGVTTKTGLELVRFVRPAADPFADTPDVGFVTGGTIGSTVPMRLSWCGVTKTGTSLSSYRVIGSTNGGTSYSTTPSYSGAATSWTRGLRTNISYRWQARVTDKAGMTGPYSEASAVSRITGYPDTSSAIRYSSGWKSSRSSRYLGGREKQVSKSGATATLTVANVRQFAIVGTKGSGRGSFGVYVDGRKVATVKEGSSRTVYRRILYVGSVPGNTAASHTIQVKTTSRSKVGLDAIYALSGRGTPALAFSNAVPSAATVAGPTDTVGATTDAGLPFAITLDQAGWPACELAADTVTYHGRGTCSLRVTEPGDTAWNAATATQAYAVSGLLQAITFAPLPDTTYGDPDFTVAATADSGLPVTFSSQSTTVCTVTGTTVSILTAGTCTVRASQAGDTTREPATNVDQAFAVHTVPLTVTGITAADRAYDGTTAATLDTSGAVLVGVLPGDDVTLVTSGATGTFDSADAGSRTVTVGGLTLTGADKDNYTLTPPTDPATISKAPQSITVTSTAPAAPVKDGPDYTAGATALSGLPVAYSVASSPSGTCSIAGSVVSFTDAGQCTVRFDQPGDSNWLAAPQEVQVLSVASTGSDPQVITFAPLAGVTYGVAPITLIASSDSGLTVTFASLDPDICTVAGTTATVIAAGTCDIQASQAGNPVYAAATPVVRSLVVATRAITVSPVPVSKIYDGNVTANGTPTVTVGSLASGDTATFTQTFATATVGTSKSVIPAGTIAKGPVDVTSSYAITFQPGNVGTITPGPAASLVLTGLTGGVAGTPQSPTVTVKDALDQTVTGFTGTVHFTSTDPSATLPANYTFLAGDNGVKTFTGGVTLKTVGSRQVTVTQTGSPSVTGDQSGLVVTPATASTLVVTAPSPQVAGASFTVTVVAHDPYGNTATGFTGTVTLTSTDGAATLAGSPHTYTALENGSHDFTVTLRTAGNRTVSASSPSPSASGTSGTIVVNPEVAHHFDVVAGTSQTSGVPFTVTVTARDAYNNLATGYRGTVQFSSSDAQATLPADYPFTAIDNGVHAFPNGATLKAAGTSTVTATDSVTATITGTQAGIVVAPGSATTFALTTFPSSVVAGAPHNLVVTAKDANGNTVPGYAGTVSITSNDPLFVPPAPSTLTSGTHTFSVNLRTVTTTASLTAGDGSISGSQSNITVTPGAVASFALSGFPSSTQAGIPHNLTVTAKDAYNNTVTGYPGTVSIQSNDGQFSAPAPSTLTNGVHTFSVDLRTVTAAASLTATDGSTSSTQSNITVTPGNAASFALSGFPSSTVAGAPHNLTVTAKDAYNNTATAYAGTVSIASNDGQFSAPTPSTLTSGTHTFSVNLRTVTTTASLTAGDGSISGSQTNITVTPGLAASFTVSGFASPTTAGIQHGVTVTAKDAYNNTATGYGGTVHFTSNDPQATVPVNTTLTNGTGTFNATLRTAGTALSITATDTVSSGITGTQSGITVNAAALSELSVTGFPATTTAGASGSVTVAAQDAFGNTITGYTGTVTFDSTDAQAVLPADYTFVLGDGGDKVFAGVVLKTAGTQSISVHDTVATSVTGSQTGILVSPAAAASLVMSTGSTATAGTPFNVTVTAKDAFNNTATGYTGTVTLTSSDSAATMPAGHAYVGGDGGIHVFSVTLVTAGAQTVTAGDGTRSVTSPDITVSAGAATHLAVGSFPDPATAGTPGSLTVTALDAHDNPTTLAGNIHLTSTDPQADLGVNFALPGGTNTVSVTLKTAGEQTITATSVANGSIHGTQSAITVDPGAVNSIVIATAPAGGTGVATVSLQSGQSTTVYANSRDAYGNIIGNVAVTWSVTTLTGGVTGTDLVPAGDERSATFTGHLVGTGTIDADDGAGHTDSTGTVTVTVGPASTATSTATPSAGSLPADGLSTLDVTVQLKDAAGNDLSTGGADVTMTADHGSLGAVSDNGDGTYTATYTSDSFTGTVTVTAKLGGVDIVNTASFTQS